MRLYGKNPVIERLRSSPGSIKKLYLRELTDLSEVVREAKKAGVDFESVKKGAFAGFAESGHTQGVVAEIEDYRYAPFSEILNGKSIPVFIDGVTDPQNLGSVIRSLACLGGFSIVIPEHGSCAVNETVLRVACGGENYVPVAMVTNAVKGATAAKAKGFRIAGAVASGGEDIAKADIKFPLAVVIGSEGKGIRPGLKKLLDSELSLPMRGAELSFNAAVATALFCYEISRRKSEDGLKS